MNSIRFLRSSSQRSRAGAVSWFQLTISWFVLVPILVRPTGLHAGLPVGAQVVHGNVSIAQVGGAMAIQQASRNAIVNWQSFDIGAGNSVQINQGGANAAMLARVVGNDPSKLLGALKADGKLFLINQRGVIVGEGATIDTAGFMASTLDVSDAEFLAGGAMTFKGDSDAGIVNLGKIVAREGNVMLFAHALKNAGEISAARGTVGLGAGTEIYLASPDDATFKIQLNLPSPSEKTGIDHSGVIDAAQAELKAAGGSIYDVAINHRGVIRATGVESRNGRILLTANGGTVAVSGAAVARDANGSGGEILVGGDYRGGNATVANATNTYVSSTATLDASASSVTGDGGKVVVWADEGTRFLGTLAARAGRQGGDGGFAEVSGKRQLDFRPATAVDLSAPAGARGTLLLDPDALVISAAADSNTSAGGGPFTFSPTAEPSNLSVTTLQNQLATSNVVLDTSNSAGDVRFSAPVTWSTANSLRVNAGGSIFLDENITATHAASELALYAGRNASPVGQGGPLMPRAQLAMDKTITVGTLTYGANALSAPVGYTVDTSSATGDAIFFGTLDVGTLNVDLSGGAAGVDAITAGNKIGVFQTTGTGDLTTALVRDDDDGLDVRIASANSSMTNDVRIVTPGTLTLQAGTGLSFAAPRTVVLASTGGAFINNAGADAIGANGRFLIYANRSNTTIKGGLVGTDVFSHAYNAADTFADTTSRFLFAGADGGRPLLTYQAQDASRVYGDADPIFGFLRFGFEGGTVTGAPSFSTGTTSSSGVGAYTLTIDQGSLESPDYDFSFVNATFSITPASLLITANNASRFYGDANPDVDFTASGFKNDENASVISGLTLASAATNVSAPGAYAITANGASASNYTISYGAPGTLTVNKAPLTVTASNALTKIYGDANPNLFGGLTTSGLRNGENLDQAVAGLDFATAATTASSVGTYLVNGSGTSVNYDVTFAPGLLTIIPAQLTIAGDAVARFYGDGNPAFTATFSGFKNSDTAAIVSGTTLTTTATAASNVGAYPISVSGATVASGNYDVVYVPGTLTVNPAPLTAAITNASRTYGAANPAFSASFTGFKNGDTETSAISDLAFNSTATTGSGVGAYAIHGTGTASANYALTFVPGTLTIDPATLTVTPHALGARVYGDLAGPLFGFAATGFVNGDTLAGFNAAGVRYASDATAASPAGSYAITMTGGSMANYTIVRQPGTLIVAKAPLTVAIDNLTRTYGAGNPVFTATYTGFRNGDTAASLGDGVTFGTTASARTPVGNYAITGLGSAANYDLTFNFGTLTIVPATLTVTPASISGLTFGDAYPTLGYDVSGWAPGDSALSVSGVTIIGLPSHAGSVVPGTHTLTIADSGTVNGNYVTVAGPATTVSVDRKKVEVAGPSVALPAGTLVPSSVAVATPELVPGGPEFTVASAIPATVVHTAIVTTGKVEVPVEIMPAAGTTKEEIDRFYDITTTPGFFSALTDVVYLSTDKITFPSTFTIDAGSLVIDPATLLIPDAEPGVRLKYASRVTRDAPLTADNLVELLAKNGSDFQDLAQAFLSTSGFDALSDAQRALVRDFAEGRISAEALSQRMRTEADVQAVMFHLLDRYAEKLIERGGTYDLIQGALVDQLSSSVKTMRLEVADKSKAAYDAWRVRMDRRYANSLGGGTAELMPDVVTAAYTDTINAAIAGGAAGVVLGTGAGVALATSKALAITLLGYVAEGGGAMAGMKASAVAAAHTAALPVGIAIGVAVTLIVVASVAMSESERHQAEYDAVMAGANQIRRAEIGGGQWSLSQFKPTTPKEKSEVTIAMASVFKTAFGN